MKKVLKELFGFVPHVIIVLSLMMITFYITDRYNRPMAFINNDITKALLLVLSILAIVESVYLIIVFRRQKMNAYRREQQEDEQKPEE